MNSFVHLQLNLKASVNKCAKCVTNAVPWQVWMMLPCTWLPVMMIIIRLVMPSSTFSSKLSRARIRYPSSAGCKPTPSLRTAGGLCALSVKDELRVAAYVCLYVSPRAWLVKIGEACAWSVPTSIVVRQMCSVALHTGVCTCRTFKHAPSYRCSLPCSVVRTRV